MSAAIVVSLFILIGFLAYQYKEYLLNKKQFNREDEKNEKNNSSNFTTDAK